jgi:CDP-diglyceride synthetase
MDYEAGAQAPDPQPRSRGAKVVARTLTGGVLAALLALLLVAARRSSDGAIALHVGIVLALLCILEIDRMGRFRGTGLFWVLIAPLTALACFGRATLESHALLATAKTDFEGWMLQDRVYVPNLGLELAVAVLLAINLQAVLRMWRVPGSANRFAAVALLVYSLGLPTLFITHSHPEIGLNESAYGIGGLTVMLALVAAPAAVWQYIDRERRLGLWRAAGLAAWLIAPLPWLYHIWLRFGFHGVVALIVLAKVGDICAYFAGTAFGRHHPFPGISPGKTTEGCVASLVGAALCGALLAKLEWLPPSRYGLWSGVGAGIAINLAAQASDLLESWVKRRAEVKDSSRWLGPSGGVIDVVDSLLLAVPVALVVWPRLFHATSIWIDG